MRRRVFLFVPFGSWSVHNQVDAIVGASLLQRGCDVIALRCHQFPNGHCDVTMHTPAQRQQICDHCHAYGDHFFENFKIPMLALDHYLSDQDILSIHHWLDSTSNEVLLSNFPDIHYGEWPVGEWAKSTILNQFIIKQLPAQNELIKQAYLQYLRTVVLTCIALERFIADWKPTDALVFNGRMTMFRVAVEILSRKGIHYVSHERGLVDNSFIFHEGTSIHDFWPIVQAGKAWLPHPLNTAALDLTWSYLTNREKGLNINVPPIADHITSGDRLFRERLGIPESAQIVSMYTSSEWELLSCPLLVSASMQIELIKKTIHIFSSRSEFLVIRCHPAMAGSGSNKADFEHISEMKRLADTLPSNVRMVFPMEDLNSYTLIWHSSAVIAFYSTVGIEAVSRGIPTISLTGHPYSPAYKHTIGIDNFEHDLNSKLNCIQSPTVQEFQILFRYIHYLISYYSQQFTSIAIKDHYSSNIKINSLQELAPGTDPLLDRICKAFTENETLNPVLGLEPQLDDAGNDTSENTWYTLHKQHLSEFRKEIIAQDRLLSRQHLKPRLLIIAPDNISSDELAHLQRRAVSHAQLFHINAFPLESQLEQLEFDYCLFCSPNISYSESFLSSSFRMLEDSNISGTRHGIFIEYEHSRWHAQLFGKDASNETSYIEKYLFDSHIGKQLQLGLCVFRKDTALRLLQWNPTIHTPQELHLWINNNCQTKRSVLTFLQDAHVSSLKKNMRLQHYTQKIQAIVPSFTPPRRVPTSDLGKVPRHTPVSFDFLGTTISVPDFASFHSAFVEIFEHRIYEFAPKTEQPLILDIGANVGVSIAFFKHLAPNCKIIALEPDAMIFQFLRHNVIQLGFQNVELLEKAAWINEGELSFESDGADGGRISSEHGNKTIQAIDINKFLEKFDSIDFLKFDIEGAEREVFPACIPHLHKVENLFVEYHSRANSPQFLHEILSLMHANGFRYHIHTAMQYTSPFLHKQAHPGFDNQLNIFAWKP